MTGRGGQQRGGGRKGQVQGWSPKSRRELWRTLRACDWAQVPGVPVMVTLTYAAVQLDGRQCRRDLRAFRQAWARAWGRVIGAWKLEFQDRGAVHWHLVLWVPVVGGMRRGVAILKAVDVEGRSYDEVEAGAWVRRTWGRIVGPETKVVHWQWRDPVTFIAYFAGYSQKHDKEYQQRAPEGSSGWGRRWGIWGIKPEWVEREMDERQAVRVKRTLRRFLNARRRAKGVGAVVWVGHWDSEAARRFWSVLDGL